MADLSAHSTGATRVAGKHKPRGFGGGAAERVVTAWGYRLVARGRVEALSPMIERAFLSAAGLAALAVVAMWVLPGASFDAQTVGIKALLSISLCLTAVAFYHLGTRGLAREVQVDQARKQLRLVWRNRRDHFVLASVVGFDEVSSLFLQRSALRGGRARLCLRFGRAQEVLELCAGTEDQMQALWNHLRWDLRGETGAAPSPSPSLSTHAGPDRVAARAVEAAGKELGAGVSEGTILHRVEK